MSLIKQSNPMRYADYTLDINEAEMITIDGDVDNFTFELHLYSELLCKWIKQDMKTLEEKNYTAYMKMYRFVENYLIEKAA